MLPMYWTRTQLIYIPVVHSVADMGSLSEVVKKEYIEKYSKEKWEEHLRIIQDMWDGIRKKIDELNLNYKKVKIYQDGLPVCGREQEIVQEVAEKGSKNYEIILELMAKGAILEGTENPGLLLEEYKYMQNISKITNLAEKEMAIRKYEEKSRELLFQRDVYIARRIDRTLSEDEIGILFMGMKHEVDKRLPGDIIVTYLIYRLPFKASYEPARI